MKLYEVGLISKEVVQRVQRRRKQEIKWRGSLLIKQHHKVQSDRLEKAQRERGS